MDWERFIAERTAYMECLLWQATDIDGDSLDANVEHFTREAQASSESDLSDFIILCRQEGLSLDEIPIGQVGHDFCLTRNHHGAGFWDRGLGQLGDDLTKWAHTYGEVDVYVNRNGKLDVG